MQRGRLCNGFEVRSTAEEREPLVAFFGQEDRDSIVDVLEVGPFLDPLIAVRIFGEVAREG